MKCFYRPQKDASVVPCDSFSPDDQIFLRDESPDAGQGAVCDLCVRSARPSMFLSRRSSSTSSPISGFWAATAFGSSSCVWCSHVSGHRESGVVEPSASVAESSTAATGSATGSDCQKVRVKPLRPGTLKKAKQPRVLKKVTTAQRVEKYGKYGLYDNNGALYCKPCGKKMDETREDSLTAPGYEQREERRKVRGIDHWTTALHCHSSAQGPCTDPRDEIFFRKLRDILGFRMTPTTEQPKGRCVWALGLRSRALGTCFAEKSVRRFVGISSPIWGGGGVLGSEESG